MKHPAFILNIKQSGAQMRHIDFSSIAPPMGNIAVTRLATDVNEQAGNLTNWQQSYDQMSSGPFAGRITEIELDDIQVFYEYTSQQLHQRCQILPDCIWFGLSAKLGATSRINGLAVSDNHLTCCLGNQEFELMTPQDHHAYGIVLHKHALSRMANSKQTAVNFTQLVGNGCFEVPEALIVNLRFLLNRLLCQASVLPGAKLQKDIVTLCLIAILQSQRSNNKTTPSHTHRRLVVDRVRTYLEQHKDRAVSITELCDAIGTSRRTLQYSFESIVGISPVKYLRAIRLNGARRSLLSSDASNSVTEVASNWGFLHHSQFAKYYRELFGEKPSDTR